MNMKFLSIQDFLLDDLNHDLDTPKYGLWNGGSLGSHFLFLSLEMEDKLIRKP